MDFIREYEKTKRDNEDDYEISRNVYGDYLIFDSRTEESLTYGGTTLVFDSEEEALDFLTEQEFI